MRVDPLNRRKLLSFFGGAAAAAVVRPAVANARTGKRPPRLGVVMAGADDAAGKRRYAALVEGLRAHGWTEGGTIKIDLRWAGGGAAHIRSAAAEIVRLRPDVIFANGTRTIAALLRETRTIPIVFAGLADPVADGFVASMARPGGTVTGFTNFQTSLVGKMLEMLKEISPRLTDAVLVEAAEDSIDARVWKPAFETAATALGIRPKSIAMREMADLERSLDALGRAGDGGLVVLPSALAIAHRREIVAAAARHRVPAIYPFHVFIDAGGLAFYGADIFDVTRRAAAYVDRILRGESPADLPVQMPTRYELIINLKTAKALDLTVPPSLLARADVVVE